MSRERTQKQIAAKYNKHLDYFRKPHAFRTVRLVFFILAVVGSIAAALGFRYYGRNHLSFFSTGPISANHASFANQCELCHETESPDLLRALALDRAGDKIHNASGMSVEDAKAKANDLVEKVSANLDTTKLQEKAVKFQDRISESTALARLDQACIRCHEPQQLHQPQAAALGLWKVSSDIAVVHAGGCSTCHKEHQGPDRMKPVPSNSCAACHGDKERLTQDLKWIPGGGDSPPAGGFISDALGDGVRRYFASRPTPHEPAVFTAFSKGHPAFGYEQPGAKDSAKILFNHQRHLQPDVVMENRQLNCADCHQPGADGAFMQPIRYQDHCAKCHSLQLDPDLPKFFVPHRDPEKVYDFLHSLTAQYVNYVVENEPGIVTFEQRELFVKTQIGNLNRRGFNSIESLERAVFRTGDPAIPVRITAKTNKSQIFPGCAKCHDGLTGPPDKVRWEIPKTNMAERWLSRGPFTHLPHKHMLCADCHKQAEVSSKTTDILLPPQANCAECHRTLENAKATPSPNGPREILAGPDLAARQRQEGGVAADCQSCHTKYHASEEAVQAVERGTGL